MLFACRLLMAGKKLFKKLASRNSKLPLFYTIRVQKEKRKTKSSSSSVFSSSINREINFTSAKSCIDGKEMY